MRFLTVDFGLLLTEDITLQTASICRFDTAHTAPSMALPGWKKAHLVLLMMHPTAIAE